MPSATSRTDVPAGTLRVDPSGSETVIWLIRVLGVRRTLDKRSAFAAAPLRRDSLRGLPSRSSRFGSASRERRLVGAGGLEPLTSSVSGRRSNQLSYAPI